MTELQQVTNCLTLPSHHVVSVWLASYLSHPSLLPSSCKVFCVLQVHIHLQFCTCVSQLGNLMLRWNLSAILEMKHVDLQVFFFLGPRNRLFGITSGALFYVFSALLYSLSSSAKAAHRPATIRTMVADPSRPVLARVSRWAPPPRQGAGRRRGDLQVGQKYLGKTKYYT
jgi:hypothetical protein